MSWMAAMGDRGLTGDYTLHSDAEKQGESQLRVIDILSK